MEEVAHETVYACKRCRTPLFRPSLLTLHAVGAQQFSYRRVQKDRREAAGGGGGAGAAQWEGQEEGSSGGGGEGGGEGGGGGGGGGSGGGGLGGAPPHAPSARCTSHFLAEAVQWMAEASKDVEGKLNCPGCGARLGTLAWAGSQCSCGTWVNPAIQVQKKQVEEKRVVQVGAGAVAGAGAGGGGGAGAAGAGAGSA
jgi:hypothetical protein